MTAEELIAGRRSVRKYKDQLVDRETMGEVLELCRYAPSWANTQVARYTLVEDSDLIARICDSGVKGFTYNVENLKKAKNLCVLSYVQGKSGKYPGNPEYVTDKGAEWEVFDGGIACQTFCLAAHAKGLGTCIMGIIDADFIAQAVDLPQGETVAALITYGYPDEAPKAPRRKTVEEISRYL